MRTFLISTACAGLLALSGAAFAQDRDHDHGGGPGGPGGHGPAPAASPAPAAPAAQPQHVTRQGRGNVNVQQFQQQNAHSLGGRAAPASSPAPAPPSNAMRGPGPNDSNRGANNAMRGPGGPGRPAGHQDYSRFQRNFSAQHRFHAQSYRRPPGWYQRRWTFGEILPALFWTQGYWLNDYNDYDLDPPPPGTVWVRDGSDALLIDRYSGEIIEVDYGVFY